MTTITNSTDKSFTYNLIVNKLEEIYKQRIEEQIGKPDYTECAAGHFAINVQIVSAVADGDMYHEYSPGRFALNINIVSNTPC